MPIIDVQVTDEVAERMLRKLQILNLQPEAACIAILLRDRSTAAVKLQAAEKEKSHQAGIVWKVKERLRHRRGERISDLGDALRGIARDVGFYLAEEVSEPGSSAADVDGAAVGGHHESVGERQGRQPGSLTFSEGATMIAAERERQISAEGFDAARDDAYENHELARAASAYVLSSRGSFVVEPGETMPAAPPPSWPWPAEWWKPDYGVRDLVKAGALIAAEIDRLQRRS